MEVRSDRTPTICTGSCRLRTSDSYRPAAFFSSAALSVNSQVNSGSWRPKCPNAAVFL